VTSSGPSGGLTARSSHDDGGSPSRHGARKSTSRSAAEENVSVPTSMPEWPAPVHLAARIVADQPGQGWICCAMASSCSTTGANCFPTTVLPHPAPWPDAPCRHYRLNLSCPADPGKRRETSARAAGWREQAEGAGSRDRLAAAVHAELGEQVAYVRPDRVHRQGQLPGDLRHGQVRRHVPQHPDLAPAERLH